MGITCSPLCISSIAVTAAPSTNCIYDQDKGFCALIAATNIGSLTNYGAWSCTTNGITSTSPCNWIGLNCYPGINVFAVYLPSIVLAGTIPSAIGYLTYLTYLNLGTNKLIGIIVV